MDRKDEKFPRDRDGEIFEDDLTEERTPAPAVREDAAHEVRLDPDVDSQESDEFMHEGQFHKK